MEDGLQMSEYVVYVYYYIVHLQLCIELLQKLC